MTDWRTALRDVNARDEHDQLSPDDAEAMRRNVLEAASTKVPEPDGWSWMRPAIVAATVVVMIAVGIVAGRRFDVPTPPGNSTALPGGTNADAQTAEIPTPNRQLQFLTPGGTRIIWVFNSEFDLKATMR
jgi:hypothetical protein